MEDFLQNCTHDVINEDGICVNCRLYMVNCGMCYDEDDQYSQAHIRRSIKKLSSFETAVINSNFSEEIKKLVLNKLNSEEKKFRISDKESTLFALFVLAHIELEIDIDPKIIAKKLDIDNKKVKLGTKIMSGISPKSTNLATNFVVPVTVISPVKFIENFLNLMDLMDFHENIKDFAEKNLNLNPILYEEKPDIMALAFIKFFISKNHPEKLKNVKPNKLFKNITVALDKCMKIIAFTVKTQEQN